MQEWVSKMKGEFHIHTTYSDGQYTVEEVLEYLSGNLDYFCITDHDDIVGSIEAFNMASKYNLKSLVGVEVSTYLNSEPIHILGYFKNDQNIKPIVDFLEDIRNKRVIRLLKIKELLLEHFNIDLEITQMLKKHSITRGTIARQLLKQGCPFSHEELFQKVIGVGCPAYVPVTQISPKQAIDIIHKCGGIAVLAHPVNLKNTKYDYFLGIGIDGLEAMYPVNTKKQTKEYIKFCIDNNLIYTAGNDFHYFNCPDHGDLLELSLEGEALERFLNKVYGK